MFFLVFLNHECGYIILGIIATLVVQNLKISFLHVVHRFHQYENS
jgi:hypothetical protein